MFGKVIIGTDGSKAAHHAAVQAADLGLLKSAQVELIGALDLSSITALGVTLMGDFERETLLNAIQDEQLGPMRESLKHLGVAVADARAVEGRAHEALRDAASKAEAGLIVVGRHGYGAVKRALMGSVSAKLLQVAETPVLVVPDGKRFVAQGADKQTLFVPLDFSAESAKALGLAKALAKALPARLMLFHATPLSTFVPMATPDGGFGLEASLMEAEKAYQAQSEARLRDEVATLLAEGYEAEYQTSNEPVAGAIASRAAEVGASMIVLSTHGRSGFKKLWLGSVAAGVLRRSAVPVLIVPAREAEPE